MSKNATRTPLVVGSRHGTIWGLDPATGKTLWRRVTGDDLGRLVQTDGVVYVVSQAALPIREVPDPRPYPNIPADRRPVIRYNPRRVMALSLADGDILWVRDSWTCGGMGSGAFLVDDLLLVEDSHADGGHIWIQALAADIGELKWTLDAGPPFGLAGRLLDARADWMLVQSQGEERPLYVLSVYDVHTVQPLWSLPVKTPMVRVSAGGDLIGVVSQDDRTIGVYRSADGTVVAHVPSYAGFPLALSDTAVAYAHGHAPKRSDIARLVAIRLTDGVELWHTDGIEAGQIVLAGDVLFVNANAYSWRFIEVNALDAATGRVLWRWRSPRTVFGLLWLWRRSLLTVLAFAIRQFRNTVKQAPKRERRGVIWHEILHGQWRHPGRVFNFNSLFAVEDAVYVATNMGLFALDSRTGRLKWYTLPTCELWNPGVAAHRG